MKMFQGDWTTGPFKWIHFIVCEFHFNKNFYKIMEWLAMLNAAGVKSKIIILIIRFDRSEVSGGKGKSVNENRAM